MAGGIEMDALWIILIGVVVLALASIVCALWFINRMAWWQIKEAEKDETEDEPPFDIPVLRDKPKDQK